MSQIHYSSRSNSQQHRISQLYHSARPTLPGLPSSPAPSPFILPSYPLTIHPSAISTCAHATHVHRVVNKPLTNGTGPVPIPITDTALERAFYSFEITLHTFFLLSLLHASLPSTLFGFGTDLPLARGREFNLKMEIRGVISKGRDPLDAMVAGYRARCIRKVTTRDRGFLLPSFPPAVAVAAHCGRWWRHAIVN